MVDTDAICKIILRASDFREVLADLDSSSDFVEFFLSPDTPYFRITTEGLAGKFQVCILCTLDYMLWHSKKLYVKKRDFVLI